MSARAAALNVIRVWKTAHAMCTPRPGRCVFEVLGKNYMGAIQYPFQDLDRSIVVASRSGAALDYDVVEALRAIDKTIIWPVADFPDFTADHYHLFRLIRSSEDEIELTLLSADQQQMVLAMKIGIYDQDGRVLIEPPNWVIKSN